MKIFFVTALFMAIAASGVYSQACHMREIDLCTAIGMFHYQSNGIPSDDEKVEEWCETMKEVEDCMRNYSSKCLSPLQRELITLMSGADEEARDLCVVGSESRARYLKYAECLSEGSETDEFRSKMKDLQVMVEKLFDVPYKQRFSLMCCGFRRFHEDVDKLTRERCGEEAVDMLQDMMKMVTTELPDTICQSFDPESDKCVAILPPRGTPSKGGENKSQLAKLLDTVLGD